MFSIHSNPFGLLGTRNTGGMSVYIRELASEMGSAGHNIDIFTQCAGNDETGEVALSDNIRVIHLTSGVTNKISKENLYKHIPGFLRSFEKYVLTKRHDYDLIHSNYWISGLIGRQVQLTWNIPHVTTFHTTGIAKMLKCPQERESSLRLLAEKRLANECSRVLAPTPTERDFLMKYYKVPRKKIGIIPCGVNLNQFQIINRDVARKQLGLDSSKFIILFVGRFVPVKGIDRLVASIAHLPRKDSVRVVIVGGDGQETDSTTELKRLSRKSNTKSVITFIGRIDHKTLPLYYSAADLMVIPSYYESFGLVALESLACGTPVIATRVGAMESVIRNGLTGSIIEKASPRSLAHAIEKFRSSGNGLLSREEIRASVMTQSWSAVASKAMQEYQSVLGCDIIHQDKECCVS